MSANLSQIQAANQIVGFRPAARLVEAFYSGRTERTVLAYRQDLDDFRQFIGAVTVEDAARKLIASDLGSANGLVLAYKAQLIERGLQPATVNRRLAALRSVVKLARTLGLVTWALEVQSVKGRAYRDTRGPGTEGVQKLMNEAKTRVDAKGTRDRAILRMLFDMALRRGEVVSLDLSDLCEQEGTLAIVGKGRSQRESLTMPEPTKAVLAEWLAIRGSEPGPLFTNFDRAGKGQRLTGRSVERIVKAIGAEIGLTVRPHGLRHAAITAALDLTHGNVRSVQRFSRHQDIRTLTIYDDNRLDMGGEVAKLVADSV